MMVMIMMVIIMMMVIDDGDDDGDKNFDGAAFKSNDGQCGTWGSF